MTSAPDAFLSYTRFDDHHDGGAISQFRLKLADAVRAVTGRPFEIFQDVDGIGLGEKWPGKLDQMLDEARFFIPIITPSFFTSAACRDELSKFLRAQADRRRDDLVLPIYYIECDLLQDAELRKADPLATAIHERQRHDWRELRYKPLRTPRVRQELERLAREIMQARRRAMTPPVVSEDKARQARAGFDVTVRIEPNPTTVDRGSALQPLQVFRDVDAPWCPEMVVIPAGRFLMGSTDAERKELAKIKGWRAEWSALETPQHEVVFGQPLALGRYPVTFAEYDHFCEQTKREPPDDQGWGRGRRPVINVSWEDAQAYVKWLSEAAGQSYRLPSEAAWEYTCRAGTTTRYAFGDEITPEQANFRAGKTTEVGSYPANPWGLFDLHGNVWEWCEDRWHGSYEGAPADGSAWLEGNDSGRVVRGGSWSDIPVLLRSANRSWIVPGLRDIIQGFRVSRMLTP